MRIKASDLPSIMPDNDKLYVESIELALKHSDPECDWSIRRNSDGYIFHVIPSQPSFRGSIIDDIVAVHRLLHLKAIFSKSTNIQSGVSFSVIL